LSYHGLVKFLRLIIATLSFSFSIKGGLMHTVDNHFELILMSGDMRMEYFLPWNFLIGNTEDSDLFREPT